MFLIPLLLLGSGSAEASRSALGGLCIEVTLKKGESNDEQNTDN